MEVHAQLRNNRDDQVVPLAKHCKTYKQKKIRKGVKGKGKCKLQNNDEHVKHKFSPEYSESALTNYSRLYYSDEHKPSVEYSPGSQQTEEHYKCLLSSDMINKLRDEIIEQRDVISKLARINL